MSKKAPRRTGRRSEADVAQRPQRSDAKQSRKTLLAAACELFAERGPESLTVVEVAKRAGLNRSTAYQHFRSRDELAGAVAGIFAGEVRGLLAESRSFGEQVDFFIQYFQDRPDIARLWMFQLLNEQGTSAVGWDDYVASMARLAESPKSQSGIDAEMLGLIGMASALVWSLMSRQRSSDETQAHEQTERFARELKRFFLYGALRPEAWPELVSELADS